MLAIRSWHHPLMRAAERWLLPWWRIVHLGALVCVLVASFSSYRGRAREALARHLVAATAPIVPWFAALAALASVVVTRIVLVTAASYGLSQYALEMIVRVLVIELIPLAAALFVGLRWSIPCGSELARMRRDGELTAWRDGGADLLRLEIAPRVAAALFAVLLLAAISGWIALVVAYLMAHGFSPWGFDGFTRMVGRIFDPAATLVFVLKTGALAMAVALIPIGSALHDRVDAAGAARGELGGLARLASATLAIEVASLIGNYF